MTAVTYYMFIRTTTDRIGEVRTEDKWAGAPPGMVIRSAKFSDEEGDGAEVVTPLGKPLVNGFFTEEGEYTPPPSPPYIKVDWSGSGNLVNNRYELTPNGIATAVLTLRKWDTHTNQAIKSGGEIYWVSVSGAAVKPDVGKVILDGEGEATITFQPVVTEVGLASIQLEADTDAPVVENIPKLALSVS